MRKTVAALAAGVTLLTFTSSLASLSQANAAVGDRDVAPRWKPVAVPDSKESFRGLAAVNQKTAWVSSDGGQVQLTTDGGKTWSDVSPATGTKKPLLFRDVEASSAEQAQVLAIGPRGKSRIYKTIDGGQSWTMTFKNTEADAFYDCLAMFADGTNGLAMSDPVNGKFRIIRTTDGGDSWQKVPAKGMPKAVEGEFGFAASGTCLQTRGNTHAWLISGGAAARVFRSTDGGLTWKVAEQTIPATPSGGVFSIDFASKKQGIAVGGDFEQAEIGSDGSSRTLDGGKTWIKGNLHGYRSGVAWIPGVANGAVAVGPEGAEYTTDGAKTWKTFGDLGFHGIQCTPGGACWASGADGAVAKLIWQN